MPVLGIESSCDETAAAIVEQDGTLVANCVATQIATHAPYGGVVPELASRAHMRAVIAVVQQAMQSSSGFDALDAIAVTRGPGLVGSLLVGVQVAKALAWSWQKPLIGVDHLEGHLSAPFLHSPKHEQQAPPFPYIALLVSGGHTALYRVDSFAQISLLGQTRDDAAGEAFDKAAKLLGLGYPGGPVIDRLAAQGDRERDAMPAPMLHRPGLEFSFSGLKTALARKVASEGIPESEDRLADLCAAFQHAIVEVLVKKSLAACKQERVSALVLTGGVAANQGLRDRATELCAPAGISLHVPPRSLCTDNAAMIAYAGAQRFAAGLQDDWQMSIYSRDPARRRGRFRPDGQHRPRRPKSPA